MRAVTMNATRNSWRVAEPQNEVGGLGKVGAFIPGKRQSRIKKAREPEKKASHTKI